VVKTKTSIYIDKELWEKFKKYAFKKGTEVSNLLEDIIRDAIIEETIGDTLLKLAGPDNYELDFKPIEPKEGLVSELIRVMRNERANNLSRQQ